MAELAIVATDLAEVLGCALAFHLLLGVPLLAGVALTMLDTLLVLGLQGRGFRSLEALVLGLVLTIGACFASELVFVGVHWPQAVQGLVPSLSVLTQPQALALTIGIVGATVMPHKLYLHSSIVQTRRTGSTEAEHRVAIRWSNLDTVASLLLALLVNAAILLLAAEAFHSRGLLVAEIDDAYRLLEPVVGVSLAGLLFGVALLAAGQSSTFTGTIAGQLLMEGFLDLKIPCWQRRLITRELALIPAFAGLLWMGDHGVAACLSSARSCSACNCPSPFGRCCVLRAAAS